MELTSVDSSNIKAIGYENGLLRVLFHSGHFRDITDVTQELHAAFLAADSKGKFYARHFMGKAEVREEHTDHILNSHVEDECCDGPLNRALRSGSLDNVESWTCPKCGETWKVELIDGIRHWTPRPVIMVF